MLVGNYDMELRIQMGGQMDKSIITTQATVVGQNCASCHCIEIGYSWRDNTHQIECDSENVIWDMFLSPQEGTEHRPGCAVCPKWAREPEFRSTWDGMSLKVYKVEIMSFIAWIKAPSARSAALFYGMSSGKMGNSIFMAAVYDVDGESSIPWAEYALTIPPGATDKLERELASIKPELEACEFIEAPSD